MNHDAIDLVFNTFKFILVTSRHNIYMRRKQSKSMGPRSKTWYVSGLCLFSVYWWCIVFVLIQIHLNVKALDLVLLLFDELVR